MQFLLTHAQFKSQMRRTEESASRTRTKAGYARESLSKAHSSASAFKVEQAHGFYNRSASNQHKPCVFIFIVRYYCPAMLRHTGWRREKRMSFVSVRKRWERWAWRASCCIWLHGVLFQGFGAGEGQEGNFHLGLHCKADQTFDIHDWSDCLVV